MVEKKKQPGKKPENKEKKYIKFSYHIYFEDGREISHDAYVPPAGVDYYHMPMKEDLGEYENFCKLENNQCPNCPLKKEESPHCPVAINMSSAIKSFQEVKSYEKVKIEVVSDARNYSFQGDLQRGLHSVIGLTMASSSCPHFEFLRPMAMFHLPFATSSETIVRAMSFHILRKFLENSEQKMEVDSLLAKYSELEIINAAMMERIRTFETSDSGMHAIVILDSFITIFGLKYETNLTDLKKIFNIKN